MDPESLKTVYNVGKGIHQVGKKLAPYISAAMWGAGAYGIGRGIQKLINRRKAGRK